MALPREAVALASHCQDWAPPVDGVGLAWASAPSSPGVGACVLRVHLRRPSFAHTRFNTITMAKFLLLSLLTVAAALQAPVTKVAPIARSGVRR